MKTTLCILFFSASCLFANESMPNFERLADAIGKAENSKSHPYGAMIKYKQTTPRQACINTIKSNWTRYNSKQRTESFISYLGNTYAPIGASNDKNGLNANWKRNVTVIYKQLNNGK